MQKFLLSCVRAMALVVGALPRIALAIIGILLMGIGVVTQYVDTIAGNEGRQTFFLQLGEITQRIGLGPWHAVFIYYSPMIFGFLFVAIAARASNRPRITR
jgi:hypothetical protein